VGRTPWSARSPGPAAADWCYFRQPERLGRPVAESRGPAHIFSSSRCSQNGYPKKSADCCPQLIAHNLGRTKLEVGKPLSPGLEDHIDIDYGDETCPRESFGDHDCLRAACDYPFEPGDSCQTPLACGETAGAGERAVRNSVSGLNHDHDYRNESRNSRHLLRRRNV